MAISENKIFGRGKYHQQSVSSVMALPTLGLKVE